jgi:hypothetical protein
MVNGYSSIKEGFASTPRDELVDNTDKITDLTDDIKQLEKELKMKKDALVKEVKKSVDMDMEDNKDMERNDMDMDMESDEMNMEDEEMKRDMNMENDKDMEDDENMERDMEYDMTNKSNMDEEDDDIEGFKSVIEEPFRGSSIIVRKYLSDLLKAVLLALLFYLVSSKDMIMFTKPIYDLVKNVMSVEVLHTLIFLLLSYIVISLTF